MPASYPAAPATQDRAAAMPDTEVDEMQTLTDSHPRRGTHHAWTGPVLVVIAVLAAFATAGCGSALTLTSGAGGPTGDTLTPHRSAALAASRVEAPAEALPLLAPLAGPGTMVGLDGQEARPGDGHLVAPGTVDGALIVRTASLELEVPDVNGVLREARATVSGLGGYISGSDEWDQGEDRWASVTYRVPVERFEEAIDALRGLASRVVRESTQSSEVTAAVVDMDARLANLRASEAALVAIMERATRIDDVLAVQLRLEDVRGQVERLEAQRTDLADQAAMSSLSVTWFTPVAAVTVARAGWDLEAEVDAALAQTLAALQGLASLAIWLVVVALPLLLAPLLLLALVVVLARRVRRRRGLGGGGDAPALAGTGAE